MTDGATDRKPQVVIIGAGFGGLTAARRLRKAPVEITLIDRRNYHLFQPLLYQVATAGLSPADIAAPIRHIVRSQKNTRVLLGRVDGIDPGRRIVRAGEHEVPYDHLIVATGAKHAYPNPDWEAVAPGIKTVDDATAIRARILLAFERAEQETDPAERDRLLTFIVIGGGPTGVELAGAIAELGKKALSGDFRTIDTRNTRVLLLEGAPRILGTFPEKLSAYAERALGRLGVEVRTGKFAETVDSNGVIVDGERIGSRTVLWAAGVRGSEVRRWLPAETDRAGRVMVGPDLTVPGHPDIFVIGDTAHVPWKDGQPVPGVAPAAKQMGNYAADRIRDTIEGRRNGTAKPFRYKHAGNLATIGRSSAVIDFGWWKPTGFIAWMLWGLAHIWFLIGFRNKLVVMADWMWAWLTFRRGMRLITGAEEAATSDAHAGPGAHKETQE